MQPLEKGITGFNSESFISKSLVTAFLNNIRHPFIPSFKAIEEPHESSNYWRIPFVNKLDGSEFDLIINSSYWKIALISKQSTWMNLEFITSPPTLIQQTNDLHWKIDFLSPEFLNRTVQPEDLVELNKHELEQIRYWRSQTIGEIIFNGYD